MQSRACFFIYLLTLVFYPDAHRLSVDMFFFAFVVPGSFVPIPTACHFWNQTGRQMIIRHDFRASSPRPTDRHPARHQFDGDRQVLVGFDLVQQLLMPARVVSTSVTLSASVFESLDEPGFSALAAKTVYAPLLGMRLDALEVAERLATFAYSGCLIAITSRLPRGRIAMRELQAACPGAEIGILDIETLLAASA
jgi:hypothetical protein